MTKLLSRLIRWGAAAVLASFTLFLNAQVSTLPPAQATIDSVGADMKYWLKVSNDHYHPGSTAQTMSAARLKVVGDSTINHMSAAMKRLNDIWISEYVPPPQIPCTCVVDGWGPCINGIETAITHTTPQACTGTCTPPTRSCSSGAASALNPSTVLVVYDQDEAGSQNRATLYASTWGIPTANIMGFHFGESPDLGTNDAVLNSTRTSILNSGKQWCVLAFDTPSRAGSMSITSALTFGRITAYNSLSGALPTSVLYGYTGTTPKTDKGLVPCYQLHSTVNTTRSSTASAPKGEVYMHSANDQNNQPRGNSRVAQMQALDPTAGYVWIDNRTGCSGECPGNNVTGKGNMLGFFGSMYKFSGMETNTVLPGAYADLVTSTTGNLPDGAGQTPITYLLQNGFAGAGGTVVEPYQGASGGSPGWLVEQFVNIQTFSAAFYGPSGKSMAQAVWSSVKCPGRYLMLGDPMCTPKAVPTAGSTPPPTGNTFGPYTVTSTSTTQCIPVNVPSVTKITVTMTPTTFNWGRLAGTGKNLPSLQVGSGGTADGYLFWNNAKVSTTKFTLNTAGTVVATIPSSTITALLQTDCEQGGAQQGTGITIELK